MSMDETDKKKVLPVMEAVVAVVPEYSVFG